MPYRLNTQGSGPETIDANQSGSAAERAMLPMVVAVSVKLDTTWKYNLHDGKGWQNCPFQDHFDPPIRVRKVLFPDTTNTKIGMTYDLAGNGEQSKDPATVNRYQLEVIGTFLTNVLHDLHVTRVYLDDDSQTDAEYIVFHG